MSEQIRYELRKFCEGTSMKGVSRAIKAHSQIVRVFWLVALVICFTMMMYQVMTVALNYSRNESIRNSLTIWTQPMLPDVTICNLFPVLDMEDFPRMFKTYLETVQFVRDRAPAILRTNDELWNYPRLMNYVQFNMPLLEMARENSETLKELIVDCDEYGWDLFNYSPCNSTVSLSRPLQLGRTLKTDADMAAVNVILFLNNFIPTTIDSYFNWIRIPLATGAIVMIHPRGTKPDPSTAVFVSPGTYQQLYVEQTNTTRLPEPYGNCSDRRRMNSDGDDSMPYSRATCISLCRQRQVIHDCGCLNVYEYFTDVELEMGNYTFGHNITKLLEDPSMYRVNDTFTERFWNVIDCMYTFTPDEDLCDCPVECFEIEYSYTSSAATWPNAYYELAFYNLYLRNDDRYNKKFAVYELIWNKTNGQGGVETLEQLANLDLIKNNFIQISIKMRKKSTKVVKYSPAVTWDTIASNLGGSLNLWLGISVITAAEIVELIYFLLKRSLAPQRPVCTQEVLQQKF